MLKKLAYFTLHRRRRNILTNSSYRLHHLITPSQLAKGKILVEPSVETEYEDKFFIQNEATKFKDEFFTDAFSTNVCAGFGHGCLYNLPP